VAIDLHRPYRLNPAVAVRLLASHDSVADTLDAAGVPASQWPRYTAALAALADSEVIDAR